MVRDISFLTIRSCTDPKPFKWNCCKAQFEQPREVGGLEGNELRGKLKPFIDTQRKRPLQLCQTGYASRLSYQGRELVGREVLPIFPEFSMPVPPLLQREPK